MPRKLLLTSVTISYNTTINSELYHTTPGHTWLTREAPREGESLWSLKQVNC